jgi:hypothetical protein
MSPQPQPAALPATAGKTPSPRATTRFSLRSVFVLTAICAIVVALFRHWPWAFLVFGVPMMVHVVASYTLHHWRSSGYICLALGMLTSILGCLAYEYYESTRPDQQRLYQLPWAFVAVQAFAYGLFAGFVPVVVEFWLRLAYDSILFVVRLVWRPNRSGRVVEEHAEKS